MKKVTYLLAGILLSICVTDTFAKKEKSPAFKEVRKGVSLRSGVTDQSQFPKYPGGEQALIAYFAKGSLVPKEVRNAFEGNLKLKLSFDIAANGSAQNIKVTVLDRDELDKADQEVIRNVQRSVTGLSKWAPATRNGVAVDAQFTMTLVVNNNYQDPLYNGGLGFVNSIRPAGIIR